MTRIIEIRDTERGALTADLRTLLASVGEKGAQLVWSILDLEVIECFDSSFWRVYARDEELISSLEQSFTDVTVTDLTGD